MSCLTPYRLHSLTQIPLNDSLSNSDLRAWNDELDCDYPVGIEVGDLLLFLRIRFYTKIMGISERGSLFALTSLSPSMAVTNQNIHVQVMAKVASSSLDHTSLQLASLTLQHLQLLTQILLNMLSK